MSVDEKLALLETAIARLKEKYCDNCQEYDCDYCRFEVDEVSKWEELVQP